MTQNEESRTERLWDGRAVNAAQKEMAALRHRRKADRAENRKKLEERNEALRNMINRK